MLSELAQLNLLIDVPYVRHECDEDLPVCNKKEDRELNIKNKIN
jgi:hypothetical protein